MVFGVISTSEYVSSVETNCALPAAACQNSSFCPSTLMPQATAFMLRSPICLPTEMPTGRQMGERKMKAVAWGINVRSEEHTSELQSRRERVCRLLREKKKKKK